MGWELMIDLFIFFAVPLAFIAGGMMLKDLIDFVYHHITAIGWGENA